MPRSREPKFILNGLLSGTLTFQKRKRISLSGLAWLDTPGDAGGVMSEWTSRMSAGERLLSRHPAVSSPATTVM